MIERILWQEGIGRIIEFELGFEIEEWIRKLILKGFKWKIIGYEEMNVKIMMKQVEVIGIVGMSEMEVLVFEEKELIKGGNLERKGIGIEIFMEMENVGLGEWKIQREKEIVEENGKIEVRIVKK